MVATQSEQHGQAVGCVDVVLDDEDTVTRPRPFFTVEPPRFTGPNMVRSLNPGKPDRLPHGDAMQFSVASPRERHTSRRFRCPGRYSIHKSSWAKKSRGV